jgi:HD superfamily phosphohydrolase
MSQINKLKIFNDPIYGFITIQNANLRPDTTSLFPTTKKDFSNGIVVFVYPGANHTVFIIALGCMHLMQKAVDVLRFKGFLSAQKTLYILFYCTI